MSLKRFLELTDPDYKEPHTPAPAAGGLAELLRITDPNREDIQSDWRDATNMAARGAVDDGLGSAAEGLARVTGGVVAGTLQAGADVGAQLGLTKRGKLEWRLKELETEENNIWSRKEGPWAQPGYRFSDDEHRRLTEIGNELQLLRAERSLVQLNPAAAKTLEATKQAAGKVGQVRESVRQALPVDGDFQRSTTGQVIGGLGQLVGNIPAMLTGVGLPAAAGQLFDQAYQDAKANGADEETAAIAGMMNLPAGALEYAADKVQLGGVLRALKASGVPREALAKEILRQGAKAMAAEAGTEAVQQGWQNAIAGQLYDQNRDITEGMGDAALVGGLTGGIAASVSSAAGRGLDKLRRDDTGLNVPEAADTLKLQQAAVLDGRLQAMMFPKGTSELPLLKGLSRVETERGIFHFNPDFISAQEVKAASAAKRENDILGLGPFSKEDLSAEVAAGAPQVSVTERGPGGIEVKAAVATPKTVPIVQKELEKNKGEGSTVQVEPIATTLLDRLQRGEADRRKAIEESRASEERARVARQAEFQAKKARFSDEMMAAKQIMEDPRAGFAQVQGALNSARFYADDEVMGLALEQKQHAAKLARQLEKQLAALAPAEEQARAERVRAEAEREALLQKERQDKVREDRRQHAKQRAAGVDANGGIDYRAVTEERLVELAQGGDRRADRELDRRALEGDQDTDLLEELKAIRLPETDAALGGELALLIKEEMSPQARKLYLGNKKQSLDGVAERLREAGFTQIQTPADVIEYTERALRGERITPERSSKIEWAAAARKEGVDLITKGISPEKLDKEVTPVRVDVSRWNRGNKDNRRILVEANDAQPVINREYGYAIDMPNSWIRHSAGKANGPQGYAVLAAGRSLVENAIFIGRSDKIDVSGRQTEMWLSAARNGEKQFPVRLIVKVDPRSGLRALYDLQPLAHKKGLNDIPTPLNAITQDAGETGLKVRDLLQNVKLEQDGTYSAEFAEGSSASDIQGLDESEWAQWESQLRRRFPKLFENYDLQIGPLRELLESRGWNSPVAADVEGAILQIESERSAIILAARALTSTERATELFTHEIFHAYYDSLPKRAKEILRTQHRHEVESRTGPLFQNGQLLSRLRYIEDLDENGTKEWFAERGARLNEQWLHDKISKYSFIDRIMADFREWLRKIAAIVWRSDSDGDLFQARFRAWLAAGGDTASGFKAGVSFANGQRARAAFATPDRQRRIAEIKEQLAALRESQEDAADIEARGKALTDELRKIEQQGGTLSEDDLAAKLKNIEAKPAKDWLPTDAELEEELERITAKADPTPKPAGDKKESLLESWRAAKNARDQAIKSKDEVAEAKAQREINRARQQLDLLYPDWQQSAYSTPPEASEVPVIPQDPEAKDGDGERSPFEPESIPEPDRGTADMVPGHTAQDVSSWVKKGRLITEFFRGFKGSLPSLPAFPEAKWNRSDPFTRAHGAQFYNRLKSGIRQLRNANDFIQREAEEKVQGVAAGLLGLGQAVSADRYQRYQVLSNRMRQLVNEGKQLPPELARERLAIRSELDSHPYSLFSRTILFLDLDWRRRNLKDSQGNPIVLPFGVNGTEVQNELKRLGDLIAASPHRGAIERAIEQHVDLVKQVADDLRARDLAATTELQNPFYFPHLTLDMADSSQPGKRVARELTMEKVRPTTEADFRGYLIDPVGSKTAIETDYVKAMYYHLVQVGAHNLRADLVRDYIQPYDVMAKVQARAKALSQQRGAPVSWEQAYHEEFAEQGYVRYGTEAGDAFTSIQIDRAKLAQRLGVILTGGDIQEQLKELGVRGIKILPEDIHEVLMAGAKETWILPAPVAASLREIQVEDAQRDGAIRQLGKLNTSLWKRWKLFMPWNVVRYNFGNLVADVEKLVSVDPGTFRELPQAWREVKLLFNRDSALPRELKEALKLGVVNTVTAQELGQLTGLAPFQQLEGKMQKQKRIAIDNLSTAGVSSMLRLAGFPSMSSVQISAFREAVFRYAKFRADLARLENGSRPAYAGAYWKDIDAITDSRPGANDANFLKAAEISLKTFGDYSDLSKSGKAVRDYLIPFYSWMEVNFKYHANLFRNLRDMARSAEYSRTDVARGASLAVAGVLTRLALPYVIVALWNSNTGMEDELSDEDRRRFHIIVGRDDQGRPMVITAPTALLDVMKWVSGAEFVRQMGDVANGRTDFTTGMGSWLSQIPPDLANNTIGQAGPLFKLPYTYLSGKNPFPDVTDQRTIPSYDMKRVLLGQATDEFTADVVMRVADKEYLAPRDFGDWAKQLILQVRKRDPEQWAFYEIKDKAATWLEEKTGVPRAPGSGYDAKHLQALRNFRKSIYRGDMANALRFYHVLIDYGYTAEQFQASIRSQDPLSEIPKALRSEFVAQLPAWEQAQLERAYRFYSKMATGKGTEKLLFPRKATSPGFKESWTPRDDILQRRFGDEDLDAAERQLDALRR